MSTENAAPSSGHPAEYRSDTPAPAPPPIGATGAAPAAFLGRPAAPPPPPPDGSPADPQTTPDRSTDQPGRSTDQEDGADHTSRRAVEQQHLERNDDHTMPGLTIEQHLDRNDGQNIGLQIVQAINRLRGDLLPPDWIAQQLATFTRPDDEQQALRTSLTLSHVLVLHAPESVGRYTAALAALHHMVGDNIRQVRREPGESFSAEGLEGERTGWILDLRDEGDRLPSGVGPALLEDAPHLQKAGSYLTVLTATHTWRNVSRGTDVLAHPLSLPDPNGVLRAHLENVAPPVKADRWLARSEITEGIAGRLPAEIAAWARAIREAEHRDPLGECFLDDLVDEVVQAAEDWRTQLLDWHTKQQDSAHRNYLLAAAVLDGAPVETVYDAAQSLAKALGEKPKPPRGQQGLGVIALTDAIDADVSDEDTVCFLRTGYAEAVVDYFWADRPHLVQDFTRWTADQTGNKNLPEDVAHQLADRVTGWALKYMRAKRGKRATNLLRQIAGQWSQSLPEQARDLLTVAALDTEAGRRVRDVYLEWARTSDQETPPRLKTALARACERLADVYPTMMLLRLTELAAHTDSKDVTGAVGHALTVLWDQPQKRQDIQDQLAGWSGNQDPGRRNAAHHAFLHLAARTSKDGAPVLLATAHQDNAQATWQTARWRGLLQDSRSLPRPLLQQALTSWMDAALALPGVQDLVLTTLQHAVYQPQTDTVYAADRYLALSHLLFAWAPVQPQHPSSDPEKLRDQLLLALRQADPAAPAPEGHAAQD
ncbi:hypothetical protein AB0H82_10600 [Streptomyces sp. NPDC050732]|uniref:hypothetical protein n=1 Tax=Streptomyces sp. NPDC050732 TaxID=3154632 RepID=UPI0034350FC3